MATADPRPGDGDGDRTDEAAAPGAAGTAGPAGGAVSGDVATSDAAAAEAAGTGGGEPPAGGLAPDDEARAAAADLGVGDALDELRRERDEYLDALRRMQADFENYRKRVQRQQEETVARAAERLVTALLPALDAFDMAAAHLVGDEQASPGGLLQAATLLRDTLAKEGLEQVGSVGDPFDPNAHEAVEHTADDGGDGPVVDAVLRPGYRYNGRTVRPAMVKVRG